MFLLSTGHFSNWLRADDMITAVIQKAMRENMLVSMCKSIANDARSGVSDSMSLSLMRVTWRKKWRL